MNPATAWAGRADELANWALARVFARTDRYGGYFRKDGETNKVTRPAHPTEGAVNARLLAQHFRARRPGDVVGAHSLAPGDGSPGRVVSVDIDAHEDEADSPEISRRNERYALHLYDRLAEIGLRPLLATWGKGGYHLHTLFDRDVPGACLHSFGLWLVADAKEHGFQKPVETFPKQPAAPPGAYGNWLRLVGKHHTRDEWASVWTGSAWVEREAAVDHILSLTGDSPELIPAAALVATPEHPRPAPPRRNGNPVESRSTSTRRGTGPDVFDEFSRTVTLATVVRWHEAHGHRVTRSEPHRVEFARAGKHGNGQSFNVQLIDGIPVTFNFSTNADLPANRGLSPAQVRCHYEAGACGTTAMSQLATVLRKELGWRKEPTRGNPTGNTRAGPPTEASPSSTAAAPGEIAVSAEKPAITVSVTPATGKRDRFLAVAVNGVGELHRDEINLDSDTSRTRFVTRTMQKAHKGVPEAEWHAEVRESLDQQLAALAREPPRIPDPQPAVAPEPVDPRLAALEKMPADIRAEAQEMLDNPRLASLVSRDIELCGVAGETLLGMTVYLVGVSAQLPEPLSAIIKGQSSAGKSFLTRRVGEMFPEEVVHWAHSMTTNALYYMPPDR